MVNKKIIYFLKTTGKIALYALSPVVFVLLVLSLITFSPGVQQVIKNKAVVIAQNTLHTNISLESLRFIFPRTLRAQNIYLEGTHGDTLVAAELLQVNIDLIALLYGEVKISRLNLENAHVSIVRGKKDSLFNYNFPMETDTVQNDESNAFQISVSRIDLQGVRLLYSDSVSNTFITARWKNLQIGMDGIDIKDNAYAVNNLLWEDAAVDVSLGSTANPSPQDKTGSSGSLKLLLKNEAKLVNCSINYLNPSVGQSAALKHANFKVKTASFYALTTKTHIDLVEFMDSELQLEQFEPVDIDNSVGIPEQVTTKENQPWELTIDRLHFKQIAFGYNDPGKEPLRHGFDSNHLNLKNITVSVNAIALRPDNYELTFNGLTLDQNPELAIDELKGEVRLTGNELSVHQLLLKTKQSIMQADVSLAYPSIGQLMAFSDSLEVRSTTLKLDIALKELAYFVPLLKDSFPQLLDERINLQTTLSGSGQSLLVSELSASLSQQFQLFASGSISEFHRTEKMKFVVDLKNMTIYPKNNLRLFPEGALPENIHFPQTLEMSGKIGGSMNSILIDLKAQSTQGTIRTAWTIDQNPDGTNSAQGQFTLASYNLGELLGNDETLGHLSANGTLELKTKDALLPQFNGNITIDSIDIIPTVPNKPGV